MAARPSPRNPDGFEDYVKDLLENKYDCEVVKSPKNKFGYDLEITKQYGTNLSEDRRSVMVQVKHYKRSVNFAQVRKFLVL